MNWNVDLWLRTLTSVLEHWNLFWNIVFKISLGTNSQNLGTAGSTRSEVSLGEIFFAYQSVLPIQTTDTTCLPPPSTPPPPPTYTHSSRRFRYSTFYVFYTKLLLDRFDYSIDFCGLDFLCFELPNFFSFNNVVSTLSSRSWTELAAVYYQNWN